MPRMIWPCLFAFALVLSGCGAKRAAVTITPKTATVQPGDSAWFTAMVTGAENTAVSWSLAESEGDIFQGLYNAPKRAGTFHIIAASTADPDAVAAATITVPPMPVILQPIMVTLPLRKGALKPIAFTATAIDETGEHPTDVTWRVVEKGGGTITSAGVYTPPAKAGAYHIEAASKADPSKTVEAMVMIMK
ncbi:MAG: hypothetical protein ACYDCO_15745 [Armatimonadota bacterium]